MTTSPTVSTKSRVARRGDSYLVWDHYHGYHGAARMTEKRMALIRARLAPPEGWSVAELCQAIDGNHRDPFCCGKNRDGREYHSLELILRDAAHVERYLAVPEPRVSAARASASRSNGVSAAELLAAAEAS